KNAIVPTQDPAEVTQKSREIADFDVPEGFKPEAAFALNNPFSGDAFMTMVAYQAPKRDGGLFLMSAGKAMGDATEFRQQMDVQMHAQGRQTKQLRVLETRDLELEIRGEPATFQIQKAEDRQNKQKYVQVEGTFQGKQGKAMIVAQLKADDFSEEDAEKLVRSIK
ncbi:MAG TPA: hypothetical protein PK867_24545, partial [Pirellulales bacterium]|nr:hypothetical protein [Pirellulales bacterium]